MHTITTNGQGQDTIVSVPDSYFGCTFSKFGLAWWQTIPFESSVLFFKRCMYLLGKYMKASRVGFLSFLSQFIK
jgi:hypothetical protein